VLQPAMPYHKWEEFKDKIEYLDKQPQTKEEALQIARSVNRFTIGVYYQEKKLPYHKSLYGNLNPVNNSLSREKRINAIEKILNS
ncbi:MAG: hypothetical protein EAX91_02380, partial [Candidatus Lokiarchaeota archaeon]|nr:hypothetical protein [Candidatus Lokiarchaeota archaeon]